MGNDDYSAVSLPFFGIPKLRPFLKPYRFTIIFMLILGFLSSLIDAVYPLFNRYALDHFVGGKTMDGLSRFIGVYLIVLVFQVVINYKSCYDCGRVEMLMDRDLRNHAFNHLQTLSFSYFNQNSVGYIHARAISDSGKIGEVVSWRLMDMMWNGAYVISAVFVMLFISPSLAVSILLLLVIGGIMIVLFQKKLVVLNHRIREQNSVITGDFNEGITGAGTVRILGIESLMMREFESDTQKMKTVSIRAVRHSALLTSLVTMMSALALAVVLSQGGHLTEEGIIRIGTLSVFMSYALGMIEPLQNVIAGFAAFVAIRVNIERYMKLTSEKPDVSDTPEVIEKYGDTFHPKKENWEPLSGDIEFRDVTFRYPDGEENIMEHFNLKVPRGTNVAIVGETGAGKSTLVNLVCRFYEPTEGVLLIDGRDARERSLLWLHSNLGYVLQSPHLFSGSVRDNLRYGKPEASDDEIWEALRLVAADGIVRSMDHGLDSEVGEGGSMLSVGEKQLLSFARALIADPALLVLDEATASVDTLTEKAIQNAISVVTRGRTSFIIAHRLSTITGADIILVVDDGKIVEQGTHAELLKKKGHYHRLYMQQYRDA